MSVDADPGSATPDVSVTYFYDTQAARLESVRDNKLNSATNTTHYVYDDVGNLDHSVYGNGVQHAYQYDAPKRLVSLGVSRSDASWVRGYVYTLDAVGRRTSVTESKIEDDNVRRIVNYEYDRVHTTSPASDGPRVGRLTRESLFNNSFAAVGTITHAYDLVGNRTARTVTTITPTPVDAITNQTYHFNAKDWLDGTAGAADSIVRFDANGNTKTNDVGTPTGDLYDAENRLVSRSSITTGYDFEGNRVWKIVGTVTNYYLLDDRNPSGYVQVLAEYTNTTTTPTVAYTYGQDLIAQRLTGTTTYYYGYDGQGSVRVLLSAATGASTTITDSYDYDAYGQLLAISGSTSNYYRYTGEQWDADLGMYYQRARYYQPGIGRFWTIDTYAGVTSDPLSLHKYLYCHGDPVNGSDPTGLYEIDVHQFLTAFLADAAGLADADIIGEATQASDAPGSKKDAMYLGVNYENMEKYHFVSSKRLGELEDSMLASPNDLGKIGDYFHALEDTYAHDTGIGQRTGLYYDDASTIPIGHGLHGH